MHAIVRDKQRLLAATATMALITAIVLLAMASIAGAQQDPEKEPFAGVLVEAPAGQQQAAADPVDIDALGPEWWPVFREDFESPDWETKWDVNLDLSTTEPKVGLKWGTQTIANALDPASTKSGWAICADSSCSNVDPIGPSYPKGVDSWLVAGPFDLETAKDAQLNFDLFYEASGGDAFKVSVSQNRLQFAVQPIVPAVANNGSWQAKTVSLSQFTGQPDKPQIWIAFTFSSAGAAAKMGAMIDNVAVHVKGSPPNYLPLIVYGIVPTVPPVTPSPTSPPPGGDYLDEFTNEIDGWQARRWTSGTAYELAHDPAADGNEQGFLNLKVNTANSRYVIASPLVVSKAPPYNIETVVKLRSPRETGDQYGIVFGGNYSGGDCPVTDFSTCFTQYYEMRVRFYHDEPANKDRMDVKLKRIDSHDSENNSSGPDLFDWERVSDVDEDSFIEWDITVEANGKIKISANGNPVHDSVTDTTYINNPYFGVIVRTEDEADSEAKFDYFKID